MRFLLCIGTRPEAIKMLPLAIELRKRIGNDIQICFSGQHREMAVDVFEYFGISPDICFNTMEKSQSLMELNIKLLKNFDVVIKEEMPETVIVHGDTATAFCASLAAFYNGVKVAHVEAGLRTFNARDPFPEELYRVSIDAISEYHFAPTSASCVNLEKEGRKSINTVGNTVIDALRYTVAEKYGSPFLKLANGRKILLITMHRRESIGARMRSALLGVKDILVERKDMLAILPSHVNPLVREVIFDVFQDIKNIKICDPLPIRDFHNILARSYAVLTDSGGIQEEAAYLGIPIFILRDSTERQDVLDGGNAILLGTDRKRVKESFLSTVDDPIALQRMRKKCLAFGNGDASTKIADILLNTD